MEFVLTKKSPSREAIAEELALGPRLKNFRLRSRLTLEEVSSHSGLEKGYISRLERGLKRPSISTILKLCDALDIKLSALMEEDGESSTIRVIRKKDRGTLAMLDDPESTAKSYQIVSPADDSRFMSLFVVKPSAQKVKRPSASHSGEEIVYVLKGSVELTVGDTVTALEEGDCVHFMAQTRHTMRAIGRLSCEVLVVTSPVH